MAKNLMKAMNVDPNTELVNLEKQFQCLRCDSNTTSPMTWTALINHFVQKGEQPCSDENENDHVLNGILPAVILSVWEAKELEDVVLGRNLIPNFD
ncbi:hypothetical protein M422DRAFT_28446 [Sphaerobolus stellatus SS14]|nr:hypothetical protein M422DRAFT_28485 [Sphaerobolus stellatus SS14]KIJ48503.1 hypothetical protein M422DRAFT_28446 [Sphaerobolus stellatus SS14]